MFVLFNLMINQKNKADRRNAYTIISGKISNPRMSNVLPLALIVANILSIPVLVLILLLLSYSTCNSVIFLINDAGDYGYNTMHN